MTLGDAAEAVDSDIGRNRRIVPTNVRFLNYLTSVIFLILILLVFLSFLPFFFFFFFSDLSYFFCSKDLSLTVSS